jgi:hypothetical protein
MRQIETVGYDIYLSSDEYVKPGDYTSVFEVMIQYHNGDDGKITRYRGKNDNRMVRAFFRIRMYICNMRYYTSLEQSEEKIR